MSDHKQRFGGIARLYGTDGLARLRAAHVCVIGIGGVGSWVAEALARSAIGALTLIDLDDVCLTNINRQIHALDDTVGHMKIDAMAARIHKINPDCVVTRHHSFLTPATAAQLLGADFSYVVDAIDSRRNKALIIATCRTRGVPVITIGGAGGRRDPSKVTVCDLSQSRDDPLLALVRRELRSNYGFPRERRWKFKVDCVHSPEPILFPQSDGSVCPTREPDSSLRLDCESGYGTASFVTGAFGFAAAARVVERIAAATPPHAPFTPTAPKPPNSEQTAG